MSIQCERCMAQLLDISGQMLVMADEKASECDSDQCLVLFGLVNDFAYRIRAKAEGIYRHAQMDTAAGGDGSGKKYISKTDGA